MNLAGLSHFLLLSLKSSDERGWIEIGESEYIKSFVRAYDFGGRVYEGKSSYHTIEAALEDLERWQR